MGEMKEYNLGMCTAYAYAVSAGYEGTEEEFAQALFKAVSAAEQLEALANSQTAGADQEAAAQ